eukprot:13054812-Ditylum_brightwellii.AAC.1
METTALAVYALQLHAHITQDLMMQDGKLQYAQLLKEQNQFLENHEDFCISGISEDMIDTKFRKNTLHDLLELPGVVGDITPTPFTKSKGIWQVETTKGQVVDAMCHASEVLLKIRN